MATISHADDYLTWDNTEAGSVVLKRATETTVSIAVMLREKLAAADSTVEGAGTDSKTVTFVVPNKLLNPSSNGRVIKMGDVIVGADSLRYPVLNVDLVAAGAEWSCVCSRER